MDREANLNNLLNQMTIGIDMNDNYAHPEKKNEDILIEALKIYNAKHNSAIKTLKPLQKEALIAFVLGNIDMICMLPTGYGKSLVYELLPIYYNLKTKQECFLIILQPLNVIINQQYEKMKNESIIINKSIDPADMDKLKSEKLTYIYSHPENIIGNREVYDILLSDVYQQKKSFIVVDEAHCIVDWGDNFRPIFKEIKQLRAVLPSSKVLALSATISTDGQNQISKLLMMKSVKNIIHPPAKENISLIVVERPPVSSKHTSEESYNYIFESFYTELLYKKQKFPLTVIYFNGNMDWVGYAYELAQRFLGQDMYAEKGTKELRHQRVVMYHSSIEKNGNELKNIIFTNLKMNPAESPLKIVLATVALGMGADLQYVERVIHAGPPKNIEAYIQQIGRAGRNGTQSTAVLFLNKSDVGRPEVTKAMKDYCVNLKSCRRLTINSYFGFSEEENPPETQSSSNNKCCDICNTELKSDVVFTKPLDLDKKTVLRNGISSYITYMNAGKEISPKLIEKIVQHANFYNSVSCETFKDTFNLSDDIANSIKCIIEQVIQTLYDE